MAITINNYQDFQGVLNDLVSVNGLPIGQAPHGAFWNKLTYNQFITGDVPGVAGPFKIVTVGDAEASTIILALSGAPGTPFDPNSGTIGQMPQPNPPYNSNTPAQSDVIVAISDWINRGCPN